MTATDPPQHALLDSSAGYVALGPRGGLAFVLADAGYDVWLGNVRGNTFSRNHSRLSPDGDDGFWAFSWDQHAALDLPAMIGHVLRVSGVPRLAYVGYSQGTTMALAALSSQPQLAAAVTGAVLLAPVAFVGHMSSPLFSLMAQLDTEKVR